MAFLKGELKDQVSLYSHIVLQYFFGGNSVYRYVVILGNRQCQSKYNCGVHYDKQYI